jgi:glutathione S-transferase
MRVRLYMFEGSNACLTAQLMLAHKRIEFERVDLPPGAHALRVRWMGFPKTTVPAMILDGRRIQGTTRISEALDEAFPDHPLYPSSVEERERVREAEVWGESFQNAARRIFYAAARRDPRAFSTFLKRGRLSSLSFGAIRALRPLVIRLASTAHGSTDSRSRRDVRGLPEDLDRVDGWLADGTLGGSRLNAADYQIAPNVCAIGHFADLRPLLAGRACASWARRVAPEYGGPVEACLPPDWLRGLRRGGEG